MTDVGAVVVEPSTRTFEDAIAAMNTLITRKADMPPTCPSTGALNYVAHFQALFHCIEVLELEDAIANLSVIHVAGTKGKGSTCAFTESILRESGFRTGLFTSPHLLDVRERFRLNGEEISKDIFLDHFWWCWDRLKADNEKLPGFFRFCTLLSLRIFVAEKVSSRSSFGFGSYFYLSCLVIQKWLGCSIEDPEKETRPEDLADEDPDLGLRMKTLILPNGARWSFQKTNCRLAVYAVGLKV